MSIRKGHSATIEKQKWYPLLFVLAVLCSKFRKAGRYMGLFSGDGGSVSSRFCSAYDSSRHRRGRRRYILERKFLNSKVFRYGLSIEIVGAAIHSAALMIIVSRGIYSQQEIEAAYSIIIFDGLLLLLEAFPAQYQG